MAIRGRSSIYNNRLHLQVVLLTMTAEMIISENNRQYCILPLTRECGRARTQQPCLYIQQYNRYIIRPSFFKGEADKLTSRLFDGVR